MEDPKDLPLLNETADGLSSSLTANGGDFGGRQMTVEVQPPRSGERSYGGPSSFGSSGEADDKGRWGPSSGMGPASQLGSQTQARTFDREQQGGRSGGSYVPRTQHGGERPQFGGGGGRDFDGGEDRQWRGNPRPEVVHQQPVNNVRPKLDLKPRTVGDDAGRVASSSTSEDPFGGALDQDKLKRQAEMQAKREEEAAAKHKLNLASPNKEGGFRSQQGGRNDHQQDAGAWRSNKNQEERGESSSSSNDKYRFNKGNDHQQRAPQRNFDNQKSGNNQNQSTNTFESLAGGKW
jgi:hypothetical protein